MRLLDIIAVVALIATVILLASIVARQRQMLRSAGSIPLAVRRGQRWLYGVGRYHGDELRCYRAIGIGSRPSRVLRRGQLTVLGQRPPAPNELSSLPASAVIVDCRDVVGDVSIALADGAYMGFVSWLESSAPGG
ncbi:MAG: DUF2550 domain-containing protein [Pseudonocardiales bacterium]